ncbi:MAG: GNAT family N-acetyltransferase [Hyphomicrobiales bacterium]|nr:GNAT family N-acetyltransferase [Hyphomicrobiales bacterium]
MSVALRPFIPADAPRLARLFRDSVETLAEEDYSDSQRAAWSAAADDLAAFAQRLAGALTLVAMQDHKIAGFASLHDGKIDMLYVDPEHARRGVASALVDALEKLGRARGAKTIETDASDTARDFFAARGYQAQQRNTIALEGEWLANTTMKKSLEQNSAPGARLQ